MLDLYKKLKFSKNRMMVILNMYYFPEKYLMIIENILKIQNEELLTVISLKENIDLESLKKILNKVNNS